MMQSLLMPASSAASQRPLRKERISFMKSPSMDAGICLGMPFICMMTTWTPVDAHSSTMPSSLNP